MFDENPSINGRGGLSSRTIGHAHRLLSTALKDGVASEQLIRNVAATKSAPKVADEDAEVVILNDEEVNRRRDRRDDGEQAPGAFIPHVTLQIYAHLFSKRDDRSAAAINAAVASFLSKA